VVCEDGRMKRGEYRKFRIKGAEQAALRGAEQAPPLQFVGAELARPHDRGIPRPRINDDFASMHEVVLRRYRKMLEQGGPFPDLVVIDGGKGQLSAAYEALEQLGLANLVAVGIAKKEELLYTR